jgi:hypothetical protein
MKQVDEMQAGGDRWERGKGELAVGGVEGRRMESYGSIGYNDYFRKV